MSKPSECGSLPHLYSLILEQMSDAVIALDRHGCIAFWNRGAERLFHLSARAALGKRSQDLQLSPWFNTADESAVLSAATRGETLRLEGVRSNGSGRSIHLELSLAALSDLDGASAGALVVARDISSTRQKEHDLAQQLEALRGTSTHLPPLGRLIPICAHCKQIRDLAGVWHEAASYFHEQFGVKFTHGICPECISLLRSDYEDRPPNTT